MWTGHGVRLHPWRLTNVCLAIVTAYQIDVSSMPNSMRRLDTADIVLIVSEILRFVHVIVNPSNVHTLGSVAYVEGGGDMRLFGLYASGL